MNIVKIFGIIFVIFTLFSTGSVFSQPERTVQDETDAYKDWLQRRGIRFEAVYTFEFWANVRGGISQSQTHIHNIDISALVDTGRFGLWNDGEIFVYVLSNQGGMLLTEEIVGDTQTVSNIEAPHSTRLYEAWYEHMLLNGKLSILLGIHDFNSEFAVAEYGALFINSSFGISKDISGDARPSIFPLAAPALRAKYVPSESWEFLLGFYNGDPGDPGVYRHFPRFTFNGCGGAFVDFETAHHFSRDTLPGTVKSGYWRNTGQFEDILDTDNGGEPIRHSGNQGFYLVADKMISEKEDGRSFAGFLQLGWVPDQDINEYGAYFGGGLKYIGLIPRRNKDELGIAVAHTRLSKKLANESGRDRAETTLEMTYRAAINSHFAVQPDVQIVMSPNADSDLKNALVVGARLEVSF